MTNIITLVIAIAIAVAGIVTVLKLRKSNMSECQSLKKLDLHKEKITIGEIET